MELINNYRFEKWTKINGLWVKDWEGERKNLVVTTGLNEYQKEFWTGSSYTASLFVGLIRNDNFSAIALTDIAAKIVTGVPAGGDNQWREFTGYSESVRQTLTMGAATAGSLDNSASVCQFTVTADFDLNGAFIATASGKGAITGILIGATSAPSVVPYLIGQQVRIIISSTLVNT